jgi:nitrogen fixation-related uncharacterized protein
MKKWTEKEYTIWFDKLKNERYEDEDGNYNFSEDEWILIDYIELLKKKNKELTEELKER